MITVYGIKNCDTMKKAFSWLENNGCEYTFIDYKKTGVIEKHLSDWIRQVGWEKLLNKRGLMWKKLSEAERADINQSKAISIMKKYPNIIKRPILTMDTKVLVGFDPEIYADELK